MTESIFGDIRLPSHSSLLSSSFYFRKMCILHVQMDNAFEVKRAFLGLRLNKNIEAA